MTVAASHPSVLSSLQPTPALSSGDADRSNARVSLQVLLLSEGHIVYHGPREEVLPFFESLGFQLPERKGLADFLQEVTSPKDQKQYWSASLCGLVVPPSSRRAWLLPVRQVHERVSPNASIGQAEIRLSAFPGMALRSKLVDISFFTGHATRSGGTCPWRPWQARSRRVMAGSAWCRLSKCRTIGTSRCPAHW